LINVALKINDLQRMAEVADFRSTYLHLPEEALPHAEP
jgi:hypothetical protein